ncbi:MAG: S1C family serine protease [Verrucomicrobiota bacterium]
MRVAWIASLLIFGAWAQLNGAGKALALQGRLVDVFEANKDAIVRVKAAYKGQEKEGSTNVLLRVGTGFFVSKEGHVLVSASRAAGADRVWIEFQGKAYATEAIGHDRLTNISVLKVIDLPESFSIIPIDTSVGHPPLGSIVISISSPLDFQPSPSMGMVTGIDKRLGTKFFPTDYIRTSIPVDGGRGGCPILDINGRFIGMTVAAIPELDSSYCLPADALARVRDDLVFSGKVLHGWLGFEVGELLDTEREHPVYFSKVVEDGPAAQAGLEKGDWLVSIGGRTITQAADVAGAVFFTRPDQFTPVKVLRDEESIEVSIKTATRPEASIEIAPTEVSQVDAVEAEAEANTAVE